MEVTALYGKALLGVPGLGLDSLRETVSTSLPAVAVRLPAR